MKILMLKRYMKTCLQFIALLVIGHWLRAVGDVQAQDASFTYQAGVRGGGTDFTGAGQFKLALVTSTNFNHEATATANVNSGFITSYNIINGEVVIFRPRP